MIMRSTFIIAVLAVVVTGSRCVAEPVAAAGVTIKDVEYKGWKHAVELTNGECRVVVVPEIGRIMHYSFKGGKNLFWQNPPDAGKLLPDKGLALNAEGKPYWVNFGGDKVWPATVGVFLKAANRYQVDETFDGGKQAVEKIERGVRLTSKVSPYLGVRLVREITLAEKGTRLDILQTMEGVDGKAFSVTIWNVTQIFSPDFCLLPVAAEKKSAIPGRINMFGAKELKNCSEKDSVLLFTGKKNNQKLGADSREGWVAGVKDDVAIAELYRYTEGETYPDNGCVAEIFEGRWYTELELLSPEKVLKRGDKITFPIAFELTRLKGKTPAERAAEATAWARALKKIPTP